MKNVKSHIYFISACILAINVIAFGCTGPHGPEAAEDLDNLDSQPFDTRYHFNPQPDPPGQIFTFEATGDFDSEWIGRFRGDGFDGVFEVETFSSEVRGRNVHVQQLWTLHPPDPIFPPDPIIPPDPVSPVVVELKGTFNLANGNIVLNGIARQGAIVVNSTQAHVRGQFMTGEGGVNSMFGELMFNPQPEPPGFF